MDTTTIHQPLPELIHELRYETATLVGQEIALAKAEIAEKCRRMAKDVICIAGGVALAYAALAVRDSLFSGLVERGVSVETALWLSPLIAVAMVGVAGWVLVEQGKKKLTEEGITPEKTARSSRQDKNWLKHKIAHS